MLVPAEPEHPAAVADDDVAAGAAVDGVVALAAEDDQRQRRELRRAPCRRPRPCAELDRRAAATSTEVRAMLTTTKPVTARR